MQRKVQVLNCSSKNRHQSRRVIKATGGGRMTLALSVQRTGWRDDHMTQRRSSRIYFQAREVTLQGDDYRSPPEAERNSRGQSRARPCEGFTLSPGSAAGTRQELAAARCVISEPPHVTRSAAPLQLTRRSRRTTRDEMLIPPYVRTGALPPAGRALLLGRRSSPGPCEAAAAARRPDNPSIN